MLLGPTPGRHALPAASRSVDLPQRMARMLVVFAIAAITVPIVQGQANAGAPTAPPNPAAPADGNLTLTATQPGTELYGLPVPVTLTAANAVAGVPQYNASYRVTLGAGVTYVPGSSGHAGDPAVYTDPTAGTQTLAWANIADISPGGTGALTFEVQPAAEPGASTASAIKPGQSFTLAAQVYTNDNPRYVPTFDTFDNITTPGDGTSVTDSATAGATTTITALAVATSQSAPESELPRGAANHQETFTLTVTNNAVAATTNVSLTQYLPAGLEFLGCGGVDNTTNAPTNPGSPLEYPGAPSLAGTAISPADCPTPATVDTTTTTPQGTATPGVYTVVSWPDVTSLAAGASYTLRYQASIPMRENTTTFATAGGTPDPASGLQAANLDNNSGPLTTQNEALPTAAAATGTYAGVLGSGTNPITATSTDTVHAEDIAVQESLDNTTFAQTGIRTYTMRVEVGQYRSSASTTVTNTLGNGQCPLDAAGDNLSLDHAATCAQPGAPSPAFAGATPAAAGTTTVSWNLPDLAADATTVLTMPVADRASIIAAGATGAPTIAGDSYGSTVTVSSTTTAVTGSDGAGQDTRGPVPAANGSAAGQVTTEPVIAHFVAANAGAGAVDCTTANYLSGTEPIYQKGDTICFKVDVTFPAGADTKDAAIADFLPPNSAYVAGSAAVTPDDTVGAGAPVVVGDMLTWALGTTTGGHRFVPAGATFSETFAVTATTDPAAGNSFDLVDNLVKFSSDNTAEVATSLRDAQGYKLSDPQLSVVLGVQAVAGNDTAGPYAAGSNVDGSKIQDGDQVAFQANLSNAGLVDASNTAVAVTLPTSLTCADVVDAGGGSCTTVGGVPTISWTGVSVGQQSSATLSFTVGIPDGGSTFPSTPIAAAQNLPLLASISSYTGQPNDSAPANTYTPGSGGLAAATDPSNVTAAAPTMTLTRTTGVGETGNDLVTQATIGETVHYKLTGTMPSGVTVNNAVITDALGSNQNLVAGTTTVAFAGAAAPTGYALAGNQATNTVSLTFPATYTLPATSPLTVADVSFEIDFDATVADNSSTGRGKTALKDTATLTAKSSTGSASPVVTTSVSTTYSEPSPAATITDDAGGTPVIGGQTVNFTITGSDGAGSAVSPLHDAVLTVSVPAGMSSITPADGGVYDSTSRTISWPSTDIAPGGSDVVHYSAVVTGPAIASGSYQQTATLSGTSLPGVVAGERSYTTTAKDTLVTAPLTVTKTESPTQAAPGQPVTTTVVVTVPANVAANTATLLETLPAGQDFDAYGAMTCEPAADCGTDGVTMSTLTPTNGAANLGWYLGDIVTGSDPLTITAVYVSHPDVAGTTPAAGANLTSTASIKWRDTTTTPPLDANGAASYDHVKTASSPVGVIEPHLATAVTPNTTLLPGATPATLAVTTTNTGANNAAAYNVVVTDPVPVSVVVDPASISGGGSWDAGTRTITWTYPTLGVDGTAAETFNVTLAPSAGVHNAAFTDDVTVTGDSQPTAPARSYAGAHTPATITPAFPHLSTVKTTGAGTSGGPAYANRSFTWKVSASNVGGAPASGVELSDDLPQNFSYDTGSAVLTPALPGVGDPTITVNGDGTQHLSWPLGTLAAGAKETITYTSTPSAAILTSLGATYTNTASTTGDDATGATGNADGGYGSAPASADAVAANASIAGTVYNDADASKSLTAGEPGYAGVSVALDGTDTFATPVHLATTTDATGGYSFTGLVPGTYTLAETRPSPASLLDGWASTGAAGGAAANPSTAATHQITAIALPAGVAETGYNFANLTPNSIGDRVWDDVNNNGLQDAGEPGLAGVSLHVVGTNDLGAVDIAATSAADGSYHVGGLRPGSYRVALTPAAGYGLTKANVGSDPTIRSAIDPGTETSTSIALSTGVDRTDVDAGLVLDGAVSGVVFSDPNQDGTQNAGETAIAGVTITLDGTDNLANPVHATTTTAADGSYTFTGLYPGTYKVTETQPAGWLNGTAAAGSTGGTVSGDVISGLVISDNEDATGYTFAEVAPASVAGTVYNDADGSGTITTGEQDFAGYVLTLTGANSAGPVSETTTTGSDGTYTFTGLYPGTYTVSAATPTDFVRTSATTLTDALAINAGAAHADADIGFEQSNAAVGDFAWYDTNANGIQDSGEPGADGLTVTLTGVDGSGHPIGPLTATSGPGGAYLFSGLRAGTYTVKVTGLPAHTGFTARRIGGDAGVDSDADRSGAAAAITLGAGQVNLGVDIGLVKLASLAGTVFVDANTDGTQTAGEPGIAATAITLSGTDTFGDPVSAATTTDSDGDYTFADLAPGTYTVTETQPIPYLQGTTSVGDGGGLPGVDVISAITLGSAQNAAGYNFAELSPGKLSGAVFNGSSAHPLPGIVIHLAGVDDLGPVDRSTTTAADGSYLFDILRPGTYTVSLPDQPAGLLPGQISVGTSGGTSGSRQIDDIVISVGDDDTGNNFAEISPVAVGGTVFFDADGNGVRATTELGTPGVTVALTSGGVTVATTTTGTDGTYAFTGRYPGSYGIDVTPPAGDAFSPYRVGNDAGVYSDVAAGGSDAGRSEPVSVPAGSSAAINAGLTTLSALSGQVYADVDGNGVLGANETGVAGVSVSLVGVTTTGSAVSETTRTDAAGRYAFTAQRPGAYTVNAGPAGGYLPGKSTPGSAGGSPAVSVISGVKLAAATNATGYLFAELVPASISGVVFGDVNDDGALDGPDGPIAAVQVSLSGSDDHGVAVSAATTTSADGRYLFDGLRPGVYTVAFTHLPTGMAFSKTGVPGARRVVSSVDPATGRAGVGAISGATTSATANAGLTGTGCASVTVFTDANGDAVLDGGDTTRGGVAVTLTGADDLGAVSKPARTNHDGVASLCGLRPGTYTFSIRAGSTTMRSDQVDVTPDARPAALLPLPVGVNLGSSSLPFTGLPATDLGLGGAALILLGAAAVIYARRRRQS